MSKEAPRKTMSISKERKALLATVVFKTVFSFEDFYINARCSIKMKIDSLIEESKWPE